ncbi:MAG: PAS domain-containing sensor histidine kinase [Micavibrio aeruginosavorus]|uniref:histidine kinase n=1 Tax=Micavibrio aeruginosavorus TaxID=349221 RepID=A0A2W5FEG5_9BACT|nr:MAG: PAS domain-containing sensor histidine kinase [Micavibrio aeruginosavorus]
MPARLKRKPAAKVKSVTAKPKKLLAVKTRVKAKAPDVKPARLVIQENGIILFASPEIFGLDAQGCKAQDLFSFMDPEDALSDRPFMNSAEGRDPWVAAILDGDHEIKITHGKSKPVSMRFDRISLPDGKTYLVGATTVPKAKGKNDDLKSFVSSIVTPAETSSQDNKTHISYETDIFLNMTHDLIVLMDKDGNFIHANDTFRDVLGYKSDELKDLSFVDIIHCDDRSHIRPTFKSMMQDEVAKDGRLIAFECRVLDKDGNCHWLEWRQKRQGDKIYAVCRDLTDAKSHEADLIRHQQQLSEAQAIGHMGHWRWEVGTDNITFSDEIYRIFGVSAEKFIPTLQSVNSVLHRRDIGRMGQAFQRAMIERKNYEMEFRIIRPDGKSRFIQLQGRCETDADGDVGALFGIMQDVTERISHERELRDAKEAAERAYAAKSQFLANMSHELRTPLNAIIGFSEMMQRQLLGPIGTEKYLDYIGNIRESGEHLLDLITDILDMSKIEAGKYELDLEEFNLLKVLRLACHMIEGRALDAQVKIISEIREEDFIDVMADRRAVMQIMLNLLSNAVKFTEPGGQVKAEYVITDDNVSIKVIDTGIGIPASKLRYVTEPFEQAANHFTRNHEGSGLGLAITKDLVELHGGTLQIESTVGVGTSVTFVLPKDCSASRRDGKATETLSNIISAKFA